jgi:hypothetical protein
VDTFDLAGESAGYQIASGSAPGGVAEGFLEFGWLSPLFWIPIGVLAARVWARVSVTPGPLAICYFVAYLIGLALWLTQGFGNAFMFWLFFAAPVWVAQHLGRQKVRDDAGLAEAGLRRARAGTASSNPSRDRQARSMQERDNWTPGSVRP